MGFTDNESLYWIKQLDENHSSCFCLVRKGGVETWFIKSILVCMVWLMRMDTYYVSRKK